MRDILGTEVRVGDIIVSASVQGNHKVGRVYAFSATGLAMIDAKGFKWDPEKERHVEQWMKVSSGWSVLRIADADGYITRELYEQIDQEYPSIGSLT